MSHVTGLITHVHIFLQDEDITMSLPELLQTWRGIATLVAEVLSLACMTPFVVIELGSLQAYAGGWLSLWNLLDVLTYSLQVRRSLHLSVYALGLKHTAGCCSGGVRPSILVASVEGLLAERQRLLCTCVCCRRLVLL